MHWSDSLQITYRGTKVTVCDGTTISPIEGPIDTPSFVTDLIPDASSFLKLISVRPDSEPKSSSSSDVWSSSNFSCTLSDLEIWKIRNCRIMHNMTTKVNFGSITRNHKLDILNKLVMDNN
jgi:hypothetical protein